MRIHVHIGSGRFVLKFYDFANDPVLGIGPETALHLLHNAELHADIRLRYRVVHFHVLQNNTRQPDLQFLEREVGVVQDHDLMDLYLSVLWLHLINSKCKS